jgi:hypothetical protein
MDTTTGVLTGSNCDFDVAIVGYRPAEQAGVAKAMAGEYAPEELGVKIPEMSS